MRGIDPIVLASALVLAACVPGVHVGETEDGIYYEMEGSGTPVVLLHGFSLDRRMWDDQVASLRDSYRVIRYDLRGHGRSGPPNTPFQPHLDLLGVLDTLGFEEAVLVGLSAGAEVAIDFAISYPDRVSGLFLASPGLSGYVPQGSFEWMGPVGEALRTGDAVLATERWIETPLMKIDDADADSTMRNIARDNWQIWTHPQDTRIPFEPPAVNRLTELRMPVWVVVGADDFQDTHVVASLIVDDAANATRHTIPAVGHLVNLEAPQAFNELLVRFLTDR